MNTEIPIKERAICPKCRKAVIIDNARHLPLPAGERWRKDENLARVVSNTVRAMKNKDDAD